MAVEDTFEALREHWDDIAARLSPAAARELDRLVGQLRGPAVRRRTECFLRASQSTCGRG